MNTKGKTKTHLLAAYTGNLIEQKSNWRPVMCCLSFWGPTIIVHCMGEHKKLDPFSPTTYSEENFGSSFCVTLSA